jgi:hypothetical protein
LLDSQPIRIALGTARDKNGTTPERIADGDGREFG